MTLAPPISAKSLQLKSKIVRKDCSDETGGSSLNANLLRSFKGAYPALVQPYSRSLAGGGSILPSVYTNPSNASGVGV